MKIVYSSGRVENINTKIEIKREEDWEKVTITTLESDIYGLKKTGEVTSKAND